MPDTMLQPNPSSRDGAGHGKRRWLNYASSELRLARKHMTAANLRAFGKSMMWVVPLTILIWIYAERNETSESQPIAVPIEIQQSSPNLAVTIQKPLDRNIVLELSGPLAELQQVTSQLSNPSNPLIIDPGPLQPGPIQGRMLEYVENYPLFVKYGVTVKDVKPETLSLNVDRIVTQQFAVKAPENLNLTATFTPAAVTVRAPSMLLEQLDASSAQPTITADIAGLDSINVPGEHEVSNIPLIKPFPDNPFVTIEPATVSATLVVKSADVAWVITRIPIFVTMSYDDSKRYIVSFDDDSGFMANVNVKGPTTAKAAMEGPNGISGIYGQVKIDYPKSGVHGEAVVTYKLPPGVVCTDDDAHRTIGYTVSDRGS